MSVADWSGSILEWERELGLWKLRLGPVFGRRELRDTGSAFLDGLLSGIERKTGWMMAEQAGLSRPWRMQALLGRSRWNADVLRDEVRAYAVEALGCPDDVLVVDETGFVKKGRHSVGVARQYSGTAGRVENSQVGVFLAYAGRFGQVLIDRRPVPPRPSRVTITPTSIRTATISGNARVRDLRYSFRTPPATRPAPDCPETLPATTAHSSVLHAACLHVHPPAPLG